MAAQSNANANGDEFAWIRDLELVRRIGKGAYGEVWLARNVLGAYRAVKIVQRSTFEADRPFEREFEGIKRFEPISRSHPGFVGILHVGRDVAARCFYYVMELADDAANPQGTQPETYVPRTLFQEIKTRGRLPLAEVLQVGIGLSGALGHLHQRRLIHRDIKPSNIIYVEGTPRLADVGLVTDLRDSGSCVGTVGYIPNEGPGTAQADIFGLGKVLYQAATGHSVEQFPCLPTHVVDGSDWPRFQRLNNLILKACAADPRDRYQTAEELEVALATLKAWRTGTADGEAPRDSQVGVATRRRVAVLHKAKVEPDGKVLRLLQQRLQAQGVDVLYDQHLNGGVAWAHEIEAKIRKADAVVILVSSNSAQSEMLAYEVEMAHQMAQQQKGRPLRLPVRVQFTAPWPEPLQPYLGQLAELSWDGPQDDEEFVSELSRALEMTPQTAFLYGPPPKLEPAGGAVDLGSRFYVVRPTDEAFREAVTRWDSIVLVKGARQMGKTSLLARGLEQARQAGARVALSDFQKLSLENLASAEAFFLALGGFLADQLELDVLPETLWDTRRGANLNFERFMRRAVLSKISGQLVWGMDEVDRLFNCDFGGQVFGLFRSWHNERALDPVGPWSRLTLAIAYATEAHLFITDVNQSPFNVGTRLDLEDFSFEQVLDLNQRYGAPLQCETELRRFYELLGGQPYLVRRALNELADGNVKFEEFAAQAARDEGIFGDHLRRMLVMLAKDPELMEIVRGMLQGKPCPDVASFYRLRSGGLMRGDSVADAQPRCAIYAGYLKRHLK
jgi:hypothetical protein